MRWYASLRRSGEIAFVRKRGRRVQAPGVVAFACSAPQGPTRVAVTVSKSVGKAVERNRVRRRIKGALDALVPLQPALRLVFVARDGAAELPYETLAAAVRTAVGRLAVAG